MTLLPIVGRELGVAARKAGTYRLRFFSALLLLGIWLLFMWGARGQALAQLAKEQFIILSLLALGFSLCAGTFLTADSLSSEKREGTLGLLFLTDLRSYDVLLGKLVATSLRSAYALLAILPVLALPLLMGGVTIGEFWRMALLLLTTLFFSLGAGMAVSSASRETRQAMGGTAGLMILFTALLPCSQEILSLFPGGQQHALLLWPSAGYAFSQAGDASYRSGGAAGYWGSLLTLLGLGLICLLAAVVILPRAWRDRQRRSPAGGGAGWWHRLRFGAGEKRRLSQIRHSQFNPYYWLALRDRSGLFAARGLMLASLPVWGLLLVGFFSRSMSFRKDVFQLALFTTCGLQLVLKALMAAESSRRLSDDRECGALELLLISPVSVRQIVHGQWRALVRQFWGAVALWLLLSAVLFIYLFAAIKMNGMDHLVMAIMLVGNMATLMSDFLAIVWSGMWAGLRLRHHRAVLRTLAQVLVPAWLFYIVLGTAGFLDNGPGGIAVGLVAWFGFGLFLDACWVLWARHKLHTRFRACAAGAPDGARPARFGLRALEVAKP